MAWFVLVVAGLLEVVWASALKRASEPLWLAVFLGALAASMTLLAVAVRSLPLGIAYAVWVGIGIVGTAVVSVAVYGERLTPAQWFFLALVLTGLLGMRITSPSQPDVTELDARS